MEIKEDNRCEKSLQKINVFCHLTDTYHIRYCSRHWDIIMKKGFFGGDDYFLWNDLRQVNRILLDSEKGKIKTGC